MKFCQKMGLMLCFGLLLGVYRGKIALWRGDDPQPVKVFPYSVSSLPQADQDALRKGIAIHSDTELMRLLEDYLS